MNIPRYKRLEIEWKHFTVGDATGERCGNTGESLRTVIEELRREFAPAGVKINLTETLLDKNRIAESNEIRMNGMLIEDLLAAGVVSTDCPSCGTMAGESTCCRAIGIDDEWYEDIPPEILRKAAFMALGVGSPQTMAKNGEPAKKELVIEWQHIGADVSNTCERCAATGTSLHQVLKDLRPYFEQQNIHVKVKETVLPPGMLPDSNRILINGKALEDYLAHAQVKQIPCCSCACIVGRDSVECRAIETPEGLYEALPSDLIRQIIVKASEELTSHHASQRVRHD
jgi:hypothetical protein